MKRQYNIDKNHIEYILDTVTKAECYDDAVLLMYLKDCLKHNFNNQKYGTDFCDLDLLNDLKIQCNHLSKCRPFYPIVKKFGTGCLLLDGSEYKANYKRMILPEKDSVDLSEEFFHECGPFFSNAFKFFKEDAKDHLKFISPSRCSTGEIYYVESTGDYFMFIPRYNNITRTTTLLHEIEHFLDIVNRDSFRFQSLINECSAIFMEMIGCDWIADKLKAGKDNIKARFAIHTLIKTESLDIVARNNFLSFVDKHCDLDDKYLIEKLCEYGYNQDDLYYFLGTSLDHDYCCQISYLIAIELYTIYQQDKEKALFILKHIIMFGTNSNILSILNKFNIKLNTNAVKYELDMCLALAKKKED